MRTHKKVVRNATVATRWSWARKGMIQSGVGVGLWLLDEDVDAVLSDPLTLFPDGIYATTNIEVVILTVNEIRRRLGLKELV